MQQLHRLPVVRRGDQAVLGHEQVPPRGEGEDEGLGARGVVEADEGAVAVVELGVGTVDRFAVEDDVRVFELEDEGREGVCAFGDGGGGGDDCGCGGDVGGGGGVGGADAGAGAGVAGGAGTG